MVAISIYRGNMHRVPDVPRRWPMPIPKITLKQFRFLLARRSKALSRLRHHAATTNPSSNPNPRSPSNGQNQIPKTDKPSLPIVQYRPGKVGNGNNGEGPSSREAKDHKESKLVDGSVKKPVDGSDSLIDSKNDVSGKASEQPVDRDATLIEKQTETIGDKVDMSDGKDKSIKEIEDKLQVLNAKKHNLVLMLKQILSAEEELKRRNTQGIALRPSAPFQADGNGTNDTGSLTRHMTPRMAPEANHGGDVEGSETDDLSNHNMNSRGMHRMNSMSPSSESPLRRTPSVPQNLVSHPSRASLGATGSPSRFALSHQGNAMNPPSVSLSGTGYIASSPSPAASGGTSVFRDVRHPSPWN